MVDLSLERCLEALVGIILAKEVGLAHKEALAVVVAVDEPAGDGVGFVAADFAAGGIEDIDAVDLHLDLVGFSIGAGLIEQVDVGFTEVHEQVALAAVGQILLHVQIGVHAGLENGDRAELVELGGLGLVVEGAADQHVEAGIGAFAGCFHQIDAADGAELRADEDAGCFEGAIGIAAAALAGQENT